MAKHFFRLTGLPTVGHNQATKNVLKAQKNKREFVRRSIMAYAKQQGFNGRMWKNRPAFMLPEEWQQYVKFSENSRRVNYDYLVAFAWLKSKPRFSRVSSGSLLRTIIKEVDETKKG